MKTVVFIFALLAFAACQGVKPKADAKTGTPATAPTPAPKPAASGDAKKPAAKPATPAKADDKKKPATPAKKDDKKTPAKKDDKKTPAKKDDKKTPAKKDDGKSGAKVVYADRHKPNCCLRSKTDGRYYPAICGHRRSLQAADKKAPTTRNDGAQTFYCPKQTNPVLNTPASQHPAPKNGSAPATPAKKLRRMQAVTPPKEDFTCMAYARRLQAVPAPAKKDDKKPATPAKADDKKPATPAKKDDKKPATPAKKDDKKTPAKGDDKKKADDKKKPAAPAKKDDKKKPAAPSNLPVTCGSKVYGTVTYTCMKTTKRDVCLYTAP